MQCIIGSSRELTSTPMPSSSSLSSVALGSARVRPCQALAGHVGLFATHDVDAGAEILPPERPWLVVVDQANLDRTCNDCLTRVPPTGMDVVMSAATFSPLGPVTLKSCRGCRVVRYCSKVRNRDIAACWCKGSLDIAIPLQLRFAIVRLQTKVASIEGECGKSLLVRASWSVRLLPHGRSIQPITISSRLFVFFGHRHVHDACA